MTTPREFREKMGYPTYVKDKDYTNAPPKLNTFKLTADDVDAILKDFSDMRIKEVLDWITNNAVHDVPDLWDFYQRHKEKADKNEAL